MKNITYWILVLAWYNSDVFLVFLLGSECGSEWISLSKTKQGTNCFLQKQGEHWVIFHMDERVWNKFLLYQINEESNNFLFEKNLTNLDTNHRIVGWLFGVRSSGSQFVWRKSDARVSAAYGLAPVVCAIKKNELIFFILPTTYLRFFFLPNRPRRTYKNKNNYYCFV